MNCSPTLSAEEFKALHNCLWELDSLQDQRVQEIVERIRRVALKGAYAQDQLSFDTKFELYNRAQMHHGFKTVWSIYEVEDLEAQHSFPGALQVAYKDHWGAEGVFEEIKTEGAGHGTWIDLWAAADRAIRRSGDDHHVFIEAFTVNRDCPQQLILHTGS